MRILMLCYEYPPIGGGGAKVVHGLTERLSELGHYVDLVTMGYKNLPPIKNNNLNIHRVNCLRLKANICIPFEMLTYLVSAIFLVVRLCRKNNFLFNHTHFIFPDGRSGNHRPEGFLLMAGEEIKSNQYITKKHIIDLMPTIQYLLGIPIPENCEGKVISEVLKEEKFQELK